MRDTHSNSCINMPVRVPNLMIGNNSSMQIDKKVEHDDDSPELPDEAASDSYRSLNYHLLKKAEDLIEKID